MLASQGAHGELSMPRNISKVRIPREISLILCRFKVLNSDVIFTDIWTSAQNTLTCLVNLKSPLCWYSMVIPCQRSKMRMSGGQGKINVAFPALNCANILFRFLSMEKFLIILSAQDFHSYIVGVSASFLALWLNCFHLTFLF